MLPPHASDGGSAWRAGLIARPAAAVVQATTRRHSRQSQRRS